MKIFKSKLDKLDALYQNQLELLNDKIFLSRKEYLISSNIKPANQELKSSLAVFKKYKKRSNLVNKFWKKFLILIY